LILGTWRVARWLLIVPVLWAAVGGSAAVLLDVPQDYGLILAMLIAIALFVEPCRSRLDKPLHVSWQR